MSAPNLRGDISLSSRDDDLSRLLKSREFWAAFARMCRQIASFSSAGGSYLFAVSRKLHLALVRFATIRLPWLLKNFGQRL